MDSALEAKLIECLGALESGASLEQALSRFPEDAERLRPMLAVAAALPALRLEPSQEVKAKSRQAFLARAASVSGMAGSRRTLLARPLAAFASLAIALVIVGGVAVTASASALPGDPLYGVKRTVENALLSISSDPATLAAQFERERVDEVVALLAAGREAEVEFSGVIESIQPNVWVVSGVPVAIDGRTGVEGDPQIGRRAQVRGRTRNGLLVAASIVVEAGAEPAPEPTVEPTPEPSATPAPQNTPTPTPALRVTHIPAPSPSPVATRHPTATPEPSEIRFQGVVEQADAQSWTISGLVVEVNAATEFVNDPTVGSRVEVRALSYPDGRLVALRIERIDGGGDDNGNTNGNENDNQNENDNLNDNDNSNDNGNGNDNDNNSNDNGNGNSNDNDGNSNDNDNGNSNDN
ncbi:MAG TPA: DUF5666 domain-containing protein [Anaerolineae bacterium]|nr:DUF5666 domain-containing protein [Anaerolineae bacterium]